MTCSVKWLVPLIWVLILLFTGCGGSGEDDVQSDVTGDDDTILDDSVDDDGTIDDDGTDDDSAFEPGGYECVWNPNRDELESADDNESDPCGDCLAYCYSGPKSDFPMACEHAVEIDGKTWTVCDTGEDTCHYCAECAVWKLNRYEFCGETTWRLPTILELQTLFDPSRIVQTNCVGTYPFVYIIDPIHLTCEFVWSDDPGADPEWGRLSLSFYSDEIQDWARDGVSGRGLAVTP